jgi:hypothetical protein
MWMIVQGTGQVVACCDGHGGMSIVKVDPTRLLLDSPWLAAQARREKP